MHKPVLIIGGGFAGVYTARELLRHGMPVTLVSETNYFTFTPLLHEVATGSLVSHDVVFEYESFFHDPRFRFVRGRPTTIDRARRVVEVAGVEEPYAALVIAVGAVTNAYAIEGAEQAFVLKNVEDAIRLKRALIAQVQEEDRTVTVNVIGGGPTGIELVMEINLLLRQIRTQESKTRFHLRVIHAGKGLCSTDRRSVQAYVGRALSRAGIEVVCEATAKRIEKTRVSTSRGEFPSDVTILCAGVRPHTDWLRGILALDGRGHIPVNCFLQSVEDDRVFALGDAAAEDGTPLPKLAQTAVRQARVVARNILRAGQGRALRPYTPKVLGTLLSLGWGDAIGTIGRIVVKGPMAWYLWRTVYLFKTPGLSNKLRVAFTWTTGLFQGRNVTEI
ncbi:NAD(P)/FAD-dependent oxidoreductase [Candidatus Uhrbacteria bacterium]|nr:NAD(P)/FAD-dependent oxidoreductase [Candidatus Uhrbacteria bacterium]